MARYGPCHTLVFVLHLFLFYTLVLSSIFLYMFLPQIELSSFNGVVVLVTGPPRPNERKENKKIEVEKQKKI